MELNINRDASPLRSPTYIVDFPNEDVDVSSAIVLAQNNSLISSITADFRRINLKRPIEIDEDEKGK